MVMFCYMAGNEEQFQSLCAIVGLKCRGNVSVQKQETETSSHDTSNLQSGLSLTHHGFREHSTLYFVVASRVWLMAGQILLVAWGVEEKYGRNKTKGSDFMQGFLKRVLAAMLFFPTCQVRVVRFYVSCLLLSSSPLLLSSPPPAQPRPSTHSVLFWTSTTTIHAQCSLPDLNHDHPRPVFPAGPQPRPSTPSVPCRTSTASIHAKCSLPDLNLGPAQLSVHRWTSTAR